MSSIGSSQAARPTALDIGLVLKQGWRLFVKDIGPLILSTVVATLLSAVTLGILAGPLFAGLYDMILARVKEGRQPRVGDVFSCLDRFWSFLGAALVLAILIGIAFLTIIGGILLATIWLYVFPLMVERRLGLWEAMRVSKDLVVRGGFWEHIALVILLGVISSLGVGALGLLTTPFIVVAIVVAYQIAQGKADDVEKA